MKDKRFTPRALQIQHLQQEAKESSERTHPAPHLTKLVLTNRMGIGDACLFTIVVESLVKQFPDTYAVEVTGKYVDQIFRNNPHVCKMDHEGAIFLDFGHADKRLMDAGLTHWDSACRDLTAKLGLPAPVVPQFNRPIFYLTPKERASRLVSGPYCLVNAGWKDDIEVKWYPRWQEVVDRLLELYPKLTVVQVGAVQDPLNPYSGRHHHPLLVDRRLPDAARGEKGRVLDMRGRWDQDAWGLIVAAHSAEFGLGPTSFLKHVFSGHGRPYVCVVPGDEPTSWTWSPGVKYVTRFGQLPCCKLRACYAHRWDHCTNMRSEKLPTCMDISPSEVVAGVEEFTSSGLANPRALSITCATLYTKEMEKMGRQSSAALIRYARMHGYKTLVQLGTLDSGRAPSWSKIRLVHDYLSQNKDCDWLFWVDADALVMNYDTLLETLLDDPSADFVVGDDLPGHDYQNSYGPLANMGVWLIRNCQASLDFLTYAWERKDREPYDDGLWEQFAMREAMVKTPGFRYRILPQRRLNSFQAVYQPGDFVQHFTGALPDLREPHVDRVELAEPPDGTTKAAVLPGSKGTIDMYSSSPAPQGQLTAPLTPQMAPNRARMPQERRSSPQARVDTLTGAPANVGGPEAVLARNALQRPLPPPCSHIGPPTGVLHRCPACRGTVAVREFACGVFGRCTVGKQVQGVQVCRMNGYVCPSYAAKKDIGEGLKEVGDAQPG